MSTSWVKVAPGPRSACPWRGGPALLLARVAIFFGGLLLSSTMLPALAAVPSPTHRIVLSDGQSLIGTPVDPAADPTVVRLVDGRPISVPRNSIREIEPIAADAGSWGPDPNRSRYFYSPSAWPLGQWTGYVAQRELALTTAGIGLTSWLDIEGGTVLPSLFSPTPIGVIGGKVSGAIAEKLRLGGGAQAFWFDAIPEGFLFANVTWGTPDAHLTVAGGSAIDFRNKEVAAVIATVSGNLRLGPSLSLVTESWLLWFMHTNGPWGIPFFAAPSGGVRLFGAAWAVDLGLVPLVTNQSELPLLPIPWVSFTWNWHLNRAQ